ncbi:MAG: hypothetical protein KF784_06465 [Fimbriimonadaceae bacterium]|nr:hypothetical protein [Fimbriimonadaceae bacterium]
MRTVVYQSYRTFDVPLFIADCLDSVRAWADQSGFEYRFYDDDLFDRVPDWFKEKVRHDKLPMSDLARLILARELLEEGFERAVWADADLLVLKPDSLTVPDAPCFVCKEVWIDRSPAGRPIAVQKVNNAFMGFTRQQHVLEFLTECCLRHAEAAKTIAKIEFGPDLLTHLDRFAHFPRAESVALLSPLVIMDLIQGGGPWWSLYAQEFGRSFSAINLCGSYLRERVQGLQITEEHFSALVEKLKTAQLPAAVSASPFGGRRSPTPR